MQRFIPHPAMPVCAGILFVAATIARADDWPQFLGPERNGISAETGLLKEFTEDGPQVLWRAPAGIGMSSVAVRGNHVITLGQDDSDQYAICLNAATGEPLWQTRIAPAYENAMGNGPRATPTIAGQAVYVFTGNGTLAALDVADGGIRWSHDLSELTGGKTAEYGNASSPLVEGGHVIVQFHAPNASVLAFDTTSGKLAWSAGQGTAGYSSPVVLDVNERRQVVAFTGPEVVGLDPKTGRALWRFSWVTDYDCNTATPVALDARRVLISSGENHGSVILNITGDGDAMTAEPVWSSEGQGSVLRAEWQTPVLIDGHLYALDNAGSAGPITNLVCVRLSDGAQVWNERRFGKSNFTVADGRLWFSTMKGELVVGTVSPTGFRESSRHPLLGMTRQAPVIANGRLYLRDDEHVVCVHVAAQQ